MADQLFYTALTTIDPVTRLPKDCEEELWPDPMLQKFIDITLLRKDDSIGNITHVYMLDFAGVWYCEENEEGAILKHGLIPWGNVHNISIHQ